MKSCLFVLALPPLKKKKGHLSALSSLCLTLYGGELSIFIQRNFPYLFIHSFILSLSLFLASSPLNLCVIVYLTILLFQPGPHGSLYLYLQDKFAEVKLQGQKIHVFAILIGTATLPVIRAVPRTLPPAISEWTCTSQPCLGMLSNVGIFANLKGEKWDLSVVLVYCNFLSIPYIALL